MKTLSSVPTVNTEHPTIFHRLKGWFESHPRLSIILTILTCMVGVVVMSFLVLIHASLRLDESQSLWQTSHSVPGTLRAVAQDVHVPLYHLILHFWQLYLGNGVTTIRILSLIFFLINIPVFYLLARQVLNIWWSLFAVVIFTFTPFMDWYANEARMYTLLALAATTSQLYFIKVMRGKKHAWRGFTITSLIGAYTHYFFTFNLAAQGIFYLLNMKQFPKKTFKRFVFVGVAYIIVISPWIYYFHSLGSGKNTTPDLAKPTTVDFFNALSQFMFGFQDNFVNTILVSCWPILVVVAFLAIKRGQKLSMEIAYLINAAIVPVLLAFVLSLVVSPFFISRYMISCVAPLIIVVVWLISNYGKRLAMFAATLIVVFTVLTSIQQDSSSATPVKENYRGVAQTIQREAQPDDIVVLSAPFTIYPFEYYYNGDAQVDTVPIWNRGTPGSIPAFNKKTLPTQVKSIAANHAKVYLVLSQNQGYENTVKQYFLDHYPLLQKHVYSPDLSLYVFKVGYYIVPALGTPQTLIKPTN